MFRAIIKSVTAAASGLGFDAEIQILRDDGRAVETMTLTSVSSKADAAKAVAARLQDLKTRETVAQAAADLVGTQIASI